VRQPDTDIEVNRQRRHGLRTSPAHSRPRGTRLAYRLPVDSAANSDPFTGLPDADRLRQVRSLAGAIAAEPLSGGITNRNYNA
jgi:hypothetical protein